MCLELVARTFFAQEDTVTPLVIAVGSAVTNILLGLLLMGPLGHGGLALANSIAVSLEVLVLLVILRGRLGGVQGRQILSTLARVIIASLIMGGAVTLVLRIMQNAQIGTFATVALAGGSGVAAYVVLAWLLRIEALSRLPRLLLSRR